MTCFSSGFGTKFGAIGGKLMAGRFDEIGPVQIAVGLPGIPVVVPVQVAPLKDARTRWNSGRTVCGERFLAHVAESPIPALHHGLAITREIEGGRYRRGTTLFQVGRFTSSKHRAGKMDARGTRRRLAAARRDRHRFVDVAEAEIQRQPAPSSSCLCTYAPKIRRLRWGVDRGVEEGHRIGNAVGVAQMVIELFLRQAPDFGRAVAVVEARLEFMVAATPIRLVLAQAAGGVIEAGPARLPGDHVVARDHSRCRGRFVRRAAAC